MLFVLSDLHLIDHPQRYLFDREKERVFVKLCAEILATRSTLLFAGDIFDFTGLTPCPHAHALFFKEALPPRAFDSVEAARHARRRPLEELLAATLASFPDFFSALKSLAEAGSLLYIPGNHDCAFMHEHGRGLFEGALGGAKVKWLKHYHAPGRLTVAHGNEYDPSNETQDGCENPGLLFTSAMYQGVIPALRMLGLDQAVADAVLAVRPEEATVSGLEHYLGDVECRRLLLAFAKLLQRNGYFRGLSAVPAWFLTHDVPLISNAMRARVTPKRIRAMLPKEDRLKEDARAGARRLRKALPAKIVVLGHTHEFDLQTDYVNLGAWIDHVRGLEPRQLKEPETAMPVFVMGETGAAAVYDLNGWSGDMRMTDLKALWTAKGEL